MSDARGRGRGRERDVSGRSASGASAGGRKDGRGRRNRDADRKGRSGREPDAAEPRKLRPLHTPSPVAVRTDGDGRPGAVEAGGGAAMEHGAAGEYLEVVQVREVWRIDDEWWREPVSRLYFEVVLENGKRTVLYRDLVDGGWYRQRG